jgi:Flp pilus assembly pilin Flp
MISIEKRLNGPRKQRGQGMTEYIIIVALIAIAAIGVYTRFGKTVKDEVAGVTAGLAGDTNGVATAKNNASQDDQQAVQLTNEKVGMDSFGQDVKDQ